MKWSDRQRAGQSRIDHSARLRASVGAGEQAQVAFVIDGSDPTIAATALSAATLIGQAKATAVLRATLEQRAQGNGADHRPLEVRTQVWYNPDLVSAYFMIPGLIGMILQYLAVHADLNGDRARTRTRHDRAADYHADSFWELIVGKLAPYVLICVSRSTAGSVDHRHAGVQGAHQWQCTAAAGVGGLFLVTTLGIGLLISTIARTQFEAMMMAVFIPLPAIFLSGFFFPLAAMPPFLQALSYLVPLALLPDHRARRSSSRAWGWPP